jgi:hypothetical protein
MSDQRPSGGVLIQEHDMSEQIEVPVSRTPQATAPLSDCTPGESAHHRYLDTLHDLLKDAAAAGRLHLLADVLAWTVARLAINCGPAATADLLAKVGKYMGALEEQKAAKRELEAARDEGRLVN